MNKTLKAPAIAKERTVYLRKTASEKEKALKSAPAGFLKILPRGENVQYYYFQEKERGSGTYLPPKDIKKARALAQKAYDRKVLKVAEQELKAWKALAEHFPGMTVEEVYATLSPARQKLVTPIAPTDEDYRREWESVVYEPGWFKANAAVFITDRGERVRSKSEQLIANLLYRLHIPYRYEYPIKVVVNGQEKTWRPDFTILDVKNRKEYYLEHFGMMDDQEEYNYAKHALEKMRIYEENGMYEGKQMIYSFETGRAPLDITYVELKLRRILGMK